RGGTMPPAGAPAQTRDLESGSRVPAPERGGQDWRSRGSSVPPARRVIEGSVPGRRTPSAGYPGSGREHGRPRGHEFATPHGVDAPPPSGRGYSAAPAPRPSAPREAAPPPRSAPAPAPAPHAPSHSAPPPSSHSAPSGGGHRPPGR